MTALLDTLAIWSVPVGVLGLMVGAYWLGRETRRDGVERWEPVKITKDPKLSANVRMKVGPDGSMLVQDGEIEYRRAP